MSNLKKFEEFGVNEKTEKEYPKDSSEHEIHAVLQPLIDKLKQKMFVEEAKDKQSDEAVLGIIVSKYCEWDIDKIQDVIDAAEEDANIR